MAGARTIAFGYSSRAVMFSVSAAVSSDSNPTAQRIWRIAPPSSRITVMCSGASWRGRPRGRDGVGSAPGALLSVTTSPRNPALRVVVRAYTTDHGQLAGEHGGASLVLMPSRSEGFGLAGVDAIVAGVPVLVSSRSGLALLLREALPRQDASRLVVPMSGHDRTDTQQWARAIDAVLYDRAAAFQRADALRPPLASHHTWRRAVDELLTSLGIAQEAESGT